MESKNTRNLTYNRGLAPPTQTTRTGSSQRPIFQNDLQLIDASVKQAVERLRTKIKTQEQEVNQLRKQVNELQAELLLARERLAAKHKNEEAAKENDLSGSAGAPPPPFKTKLPNDIKEVYISAIDHDHLWLTRVDKEKLRDKFVSDLESIVGKCRPLPDHDVSIGMPCIAFSINYDRWYRALVLSPLVDDTCSVVWVDFGDKEQVKKGFVLDMKKEERNKSLYSLPIKNKWTDNEQALYKLQAEMTAENKQLKLFFVAESKQKNDALGGLVDINGEIYVGTAETPRSMTLIGYLKSMQPIDTQKRHQKRTTQEVKENEVTATTVISLSSAEYHIANVDKIGEGGFGKVYSGVKVHSGTPQCTSDCQQRLGGQPCRHSFKRLIHRKKYAFKIIDLAKLRPDIDVYQFMKRLKAEVDIQMSMDHDCILKLFEYKKNRLEIILRLKYCEGNSITLFMKKTEKHLNQYQAATAFRRLISAIVYMHSCQILHRDIKLSNILLEKEGNFHTSVLGDFGLAIDISKEVQKEGQRVGTRHYWSPEFEQEGSSKQSDIWACGIAYYKMLTGFYPRKGATLSSDADSTIQTETDYVIKQCLRPNPNDRPSAVHLLQTL